MLHQFLLQEVKRMRKTLVAVLSGLVLTMITAFTAQPVREVEAEIAKQPTMVEPAKLTINHLPLKQVGKVFGERHKAFNIGVGDKFQQVAVTEFRDGKCCYTFQEWLDENAGTISTSYCIESSIGVKKGNIEELLKEYCSNLVGFKYGKDFSAEDDDGNKCCIRFSDDGSVMVSFFTHSKDLGDDKTVCNYDLALQEG